MINCLDTYRLERHESFYGLEKSTIDKDEAEDALYKSKKFLKSVQQQNFKLLSALGYEPENETSHLDLALFNLYQGRFNEFQVELNSLRENLEPPPNEKNNHI